MLKQKIKISLKTSSKYAYVLRNGENITITNVKDKPRSMGEMLDALLERHGTSLESVISLVFDSETQKWAAAESILLQVRK